MHITENKDFVNFLEDAIGPANAMSAIAALEDVASVSIRLNPLKPLSLFTGSGVSSQVKDRRFPGIQYQPMIGSLFKDNVAWNKYGYFLKERPVFTMDPVFHAGGYYVQDSSAMFVGYVFRQVAKRFTDLERPLRVLDLCAAPGGKTTDLAASLRELRGDSFILVANEVMKQRVNLLCDNIAKWGEPNIIVTSVDPKAFDALKGFFDIIVADVPCSGEGMFRKDEEAVKQWSADNVALCEARQRRIVGDVWPALAEEGILVYSTCTFNKYENDGNVRWIAETLGAKIIDVEYNFKGPLETEFGISLVPGLVMGEGQYCAALSRTAANKEFRLEQSRNIKFSAMNLYSLFNRKMILKKKGSSVIAVPEVIKSEISSLEAVRPIMCGVAVGTVKGSDLVPDADLALSNALDESAFPKEEVSIDKALAYLHKDTISFQDAPRGLILVSYCGLPLGFVKNIGNRCNNLLPHDRRIRMNIY